MELQYIVTASDEGRKVYSILRNKLNISAALVKRLKNSDGIFLNGEKAYTTVRVRAGDIVSALVLNGERESDVEPEDGPIDIIYENAGYIAVNKPCGMIVHPSRARYHGSLAAFATGYLKRTGQDGVIHVVNRLDRDTSGVVIMAKSAYYKALLSKYLGGDNSEKRYIAILGGELPETSGVIDLPIRRKEPEKMLRIVAPDGKRAVTEYRVLGCASVCEEKITLAEFILKTGRTHQIRVHASYMGVPLLGDGLYGNGKTAILSQKLKISSQALHAYCLSFFDPIEGKKMKLVAPVNREELSEVLKRYFREYTLKI